MARQFILLLWGLSVKARITDTLTWTTETLSTTCCQGTNQLLMWNFTKGVNERIMELQWFSNETTLICLDSETIGFHVETLYHGRVVRNGTAGIILKNVSSNDAGKYTLYVKLAEEKIRNVQHISLTVVEQVPYECKPIIEIHSPNVIYCSTTCLERSQLSPEWIINGTRDQVGIGRYFTINAGISEHAFCCLRGLKCHDDDQFRFCMPNPIPSMGSTFKEDIHKRAPGINYDGNQTLYVLTILVVVITSVLLIVVVIAVAYFLRTRHRSQTSKTETQLLGSSLEYQELRTPPAAMNPPMVTRLLEN